MWVVAALIGWNYGVMFTLFRATCLQYYGPTAHATNYGLLFMACALAGFLGLLVCGWIKDAMGTYFAPFLSGAAMVTISALIIAFMKAPARKQGLRCGEERMKGL